MSQFNFEVKTDLATLSNVAIEANFAEVEAWLTEAVKPYQNLAITDETLSEAKSIRANVRKVKDAINQQKIAVKNAVMKTYTETFEPQAKKLMAICDETVQAIDSGVKEIENRRKEEKIASIRAEFDNLIVPEISGFITFEDIFNDKWGNTTYKLDDAFAEVASALETVKSDLFTIRSLGSEFEPSLLDEYARSHNLRTVIAKDNALKARKKAEEERKAAEVQNTFTESENTAETEPEPVETSYQGIKPIDSEAPKKPKTYTLRFEVVVTAEQANALKACFTENGILYKKI